MKYLVTGAAGFIGANVSKRLCAMGHEVVGIDNLNDYYDVGLKLARLAPLEALSNFLFWFVQKGKAIGSSLFLWVGHEKVVRQRCVGRATDGEGRNHWGFGIYRS